MNVQKVLMQIALKPPLLRYIWHVLDKYFRLFDFFSDDFAELIIKIR